MNNWRKVFARNRDLPERTYKISGDNDQLDELERVFDFITYCCGVGHSTSITLDIDGDGAANIRVEKEGGELIPLDDERVKEDEKGHDISFGFGN